MLYWIELSADGEYWLGMISDPETMGDESAAVIRSRDYDKVISHMEEYYAPYGSPKYAIED